MAVEYDRDTDTLGIDVRVVVNNPLHGVRSPFDPDHTQRQLTVYIGKEGDPPIRFGDDTDIEVGTGRAPSIPTGLRARPVVGFRGLLDVTWNVVDFATSYLLRWRVAARAGTVAGDWTIVDVGNVLERRLDGLPPLTRIEVQVTARNAYGTSREPDSEGLRQGWSDSVFSTPEFALPGLGEHILWGSAVLRFAQATWTIETP